MASRLPSPADRSAELAELAHAILADHDLPATAHYLQLFGRVYRHFLEAVPPHQRNRDRLADLFRASIGLPPPHGDARPAPELEREVKRLAGMVAELESQARAWSVERIALEAGAEQGRTVVTNLYHELAAQLAAEQRQLAEREVALQRREAELNQRLAQIEETERTLLPRMTTAARPEMETVLALEGVALRGELMEVTMELTEVVEKLEQIATGDGGSPLVAAIRRLKEEAAAAGIDALTGLAGRALFDRDLGHALAANQRTRYTRATNQTVVAIYLDLDGFKAVNDTHGHATGDALLRAVAAVFGARCRENDRAYRLGGDEFLLLLTDTDAPGAAHVAEVVRDAIRNVAVASDTGTMVRITASLGVADANVCGRAVVRCADLALYRAKEEGGDRITTYCDDAFSAPLPPGVAASFLDAVRGRLERNEPTTVAAVAPGAGEMAILWEQLRDLFPEARIEECGEDIVLVTDGNRSEAVADAIAHGIHGVTATAGATDLTEIPAVDGASPTARLAVLINTPLTLAHEALGA
ncbi:MAG: diguanylate cyclase [Deltaproteobacteria bacterium]|nr:diguanylate cyclase [Deltaproteobacteria bacterium]PIU80234.1 MAG: hypothetical protein COS73_00305 [Nitrospirae bacterium CG06_land_8_20_14_3_00_70_43]PIX83976.1 MAG: hypothetical protein COZ33_02630 [Nitrospirae bacterium CG_4_10_14_3_um_filter_70_108]PJB95064.1 MAG: hypothetical protein CO080_09810 [Nitrospirae bacterium CG_4_9_14_0_8_um_filter_70_14]HBB41760.1 hypothetical protein [Pseudomonadota bacterium]